MPDAAPLTTLDPKAWLACALRQTDAAQEEEAPGLLQRALTPQRAPSPEQARLLCAQLARSHYENFHVLSRLVPEELVDDFAAVYAFCRWADDLADELGGGPLQRRLASSLLAWWRKLTVQCFAHARGEDDEPPGHPVFIALAQTAQRRGLDEAPFHRLIDAFEQDQRVVRYDTWEQLLDYCQGSANPVGRIVLALAGCRGDGPGDAEQLLRSDAICTALQLTNFWQDVRRDLLERDRVYLPLAETGLDAQTLRDWATRPNDPACRVAFIKALRPLVERTQRLFDEGAELPRMVDQRVRAVVWLFAAGGRRTLRKVERAGCATLWTRPRLTAWDKASLLARAWLVHRAPRGALHAERFAAVPQPSDGGAS